VKEPAVKILIVEDEKKTGEYLTKGLTEAGFVVDLADNGLNGYHLAMTSDYDLLILDIMLPDVNGWDIVRMRAPGKACRSCCLPRWAPLSIG
jgi:two-component system copper resistance phosphate regulon response regulator CusR